MLATRRSCARTTKETEIRRFNELCAEFGDGAGNACYTITGGCSIAFTTGAGDFTPPTIVDARMVNNLGTSDFGETIGDSFSMTFSEPMNGTSTGNGCGVAPSPCTIQVQDQDGSVYFEDTMMFVVLRELWVISNRKPEWVATTGAASHPLPSVASEIQPSVAKRFRTIHNTSRGKHSRSSRSSAAGAPAPKRWRRWSPWGSGSARPSSW